MQVFERAGGGVQEDERGFVTGLQVISACSSCLVQDSFWLLLHEGAYLLATFFRFVPCYCLSRLNDFFCR